MMTKNIIKSSITMMAISACAVFGLSSCDTGTSPGETNVERSEIIEPEETENVQSSIEDDTTNMERHYDHADHENHDDNDAEVIGDGAYDGRGNGQQRGEVDNQ